ncbi:MAG TPA: hypothetical protein VGG20_10360 [Thermoanaerobaculia bacterium]|jgi:hypothetical protein
MPICNKIMAMDNDREEEVKGPDELTSVHEIAEGWPARIVELAGSWSDDDFPTLEEIRAWEPLEPGSSG